MRKIKNFKVNLRVREIVRVIKKLTNSAELAVDLEEAVQRGCHFYSKFLAPAVVYDTFAKGSLAFLYEKDAPQKWVAQSVFFLTIGDKLSEEFAKNETAYGEHTSKIVSAIAVDALEQSKNFLQRILSNEAEGESCDLSRSVELPKDYYAQASQILPIDKINLILQDGAFIPQYSACGLFYWTPNKKKNKK
jgi:hypothetical protein